MSSPPLVTCTRTLEFDPGHRVMLHESKCANLHGHRYKVEITARGSQLDPVGRVIDFSVLKDKIGGWIDASWDHGLILKSDDPMVALLANVRFENGGFQKISVMQNNPTAENMAEKLLTEVCPAELVGTGVTVVKVVLWETPNCNATAELA